MLKLIHLSARTHEADEPGTMELFEKTVFNLLSMPPMPRKRKKA